MNKKIVLLEPETHNELTKAKADLGLKKHRNVTYNEAIKFLIRKKIDFLKGRK